MILQGHVLMQKIVVITPTHNAQNALSHLAVQLASQDIPGLEWLIVDDHSTDGTADYIESLSGQYDHKIHLVRHTGPRGQAAAFCVGFQQAIDRGADIIVQMNVGAHQPQYLAQMLDLLNRGHFDMVIGARYADSTAKGQPWPRKALSSLVRASAPVILNMPINDPASSFRVWRVTALQDVDFNRVQTKGEAFMVELAYRAHRLGYRIGEVPVYVTHHHDNQTNNALAQEAASHLWMRLRYRGLTPSRRKSWGIKPI